MPCLLIQAGAEDVTPLDMSSSPVLQRTFTVSVQIVAQSVANLDDLLDGIVAEVEVAMSAIGDVAGRSDGVILTGISEPEISGDGDQPVARCTMNYAVTYFAKQDAPDVGL